MQNDNKLTISILFTILGSLINSDKLYYPGVAAIYLFALGAFITFILFSVHICSGNLLWTKLVIKNLLVVTVAVVLIFVHGLLSTGIHLKHFYMSMGLLFFVVIFLSAYLKLLNLKLLFYGVVILGVFESAICFGQAMSILDSPNKYFHITGTWRNPNVTAMFLASTFPFLVLSAKGDRSSLRRFWSVVIILVYLAALYFLRCRTASLAVIAMISTAMILYYWQKIKMAINQKKTWSVLFLTIVAVCIGFTLHSMYRSKKDSADGRKLIWKLSYEMLCEKPLWGYGYGNFEREYNLNQAAYFNDGRAIESEIHNATFTITAYNEFLEQVVQGGLVFGGFNVFLVVSLLFLYPKKNKETDSGSDIKCSFFRLDNDAATASYLSIGIFLFMSLFNFTVQAVPVFVVFLLASGILVANHSIWNEHSIVKLKRKPLAVYLIVFLIFLLNSFMILKKGISDIKNLHASKLAKHGQFEEAITLLENLQDIRDYDGYWINFGNIAYVSKQYKKALAAYQNAARLTSNPDVYIQVGKCHQISGELDLAMDNYKLAGNIAPKKLYPRFLQMNIYRLTQNNQKALQIAREILNEKVKIPSPEVTLIRSKTENFLMKNSSIIK